jgi:alpha-galactosidase
VKKIKFAIVGAGSVSFCPLTLTDILLSDQFAQTDIEVYLMDINQKALDVSAAFCRELLAHMNRSITLNASVCLDSAVEGADFVITAIEVDRYHYWSQDFHMPRRYGFRQVYGENGGPGGMFHTLRNLPPLIEIARAMERGCPDAWLLNYTNPEAKLVEGIHRLTKIKAVGLCHGDIMGINQLAQFLQMPYEKIGVSLVGLNHFGWFTKIWDKETGEDLYPKLREMERKADMLAHWDEFALSRTMFRTYGLWPYPGANHIGEYIAWSDAFLAGASINYYFDPAAENPWETMKTPPFIYSHSGDPTNRPLFPEKTAGKDDGSEYIELFDAAKANPRVSGEYAIPIAEAVFFDKPYEVGAVNMPNKGYAPNLPKDMVIELPALADGKGIHPHNCDALPDAVAAMIHTQGAIHKLVIEAYAEGSRNKLLQAVLLDPTVSSYSNAVAMINEMCVLQKDMLPEMKW